MALLNMAKSCLLETEKMIHVGGLTHSEMVQEVRHIQKSLKDGQKVGYIYTNQYLKYPSSPKSNAHTECLIISKDILLDPHHLPILQTKNHKGLNNISFQSISQEYHFTREI